MSTNQGPWRPGPYAPYDQYPGWAYPPQAPKPGTIPLRPLNFGEVFGGVFSTLRRYLKPIYLPLAIVAGAAALLVIVGAVVVAALLGDATSDSSQWTAGQGAAVAVAIVGAYVIVLIAALALSTVAASTGMIVLGHAVLGRPLTARQAWSESKPFFWRVLGTQILTGLVAIVVPVACGLPVFLIAALADSPAVADVGVGVVMVGFLGAAYVSVRLVLAVPVLVMERQRSVWAAIKRAWRLNEGAWWRSLGIPYLINMIGSFATQFVMVPFFFLGVFGLFAFSTPDSNGDTTGPSVAGVVVMVAFFVIGGGLSITLGMPLTPLANGVLYLDRRMRTENLAPSLIEAAGLPPFPPFPGYGPPQPPPAAPPAETPPPADSPPPGDTPPPADES